MDNTVFATELKQIQRLLHGQIDATEITGIRDFFDAQCSLTPDNNEPVATPPKKKPVSHWIKLHLYEWQSEEHARTFFKEWWDARPSACNCKDAESILEANPISFECADSFFRSGVGLHNAVSAKPELAATHPQMSDEDAYRKWKMRPCQRIPPVKLERNLAIATALSPNRIARQLLCVNSWLESGYHVIANQTSKEMETFPKLFEAISDRIEWRINDDVESFYNFKTQKIRNLVSIENSMLINADCEMAGEYDWRPGDISTFFLRWNYNQGEEAREFEWGLDGVWLTQEALGVLPVDFPYCIGQAMWDYAIPHLLMLKRIPFRIDHRPWLYHENHQQNWTQPYWQKGADWLEQNGYHSPLAYSDKFRQSLDPEWYYDYNRGFWVQKEV